MCDVGARHLRVSESKPGWHVVIPMSLFDELLDLPSIGQAHKPVPFHSAHYPAGNRVVDYRVGGEYFVIRVPIPIVDIVAVATRTSSISSRSEISCRGSAMSELPGRGPYVFVADASREFD